MKERRKGEWGLIPKRKPRFFKQGVNWYYDTREGGKRGPFSFLQEAEIDAAEYLAEINSFGENQNSA